MPKGESLKPYQFKGKGLGIKHNSQPVSVLLPPEIDALIRALPNRSDWMRRVLTEAAQRELTGGSN
jgi:hypothetical protein